MILALVSEPLPFFAESSISFAQRAANASIYLIPELTPFLNASSHLEVLGLRFSYLSENRSKSARARAICDHGWTRRTSPEALIGRIRRNLSGREIGRSIGKAGGIGRICPTRAACGSADDLT